MKKKILGILIALGIAIPTYASIAVSPTRIEINANKIKTNYCTTAIDIKGDSKVPMRFKAYPGYFKINERGEMVMLDSSNEPQDISKKIRFVPSEFNVAQGKSQKLRINIAGLNQLPDGESRAILYIEDINPKEYSINNLNQGIGTQLIVKSRVGVPIYVDKGKVTKIAEIEEFKIIPEKDGLYAVMKILSKGNSKIRYNKTVQIYRDKKIIEEYFLNGKAVGNNNYYIDKHKIKTDKITESGDYTLIIIISYFDENGKKKNIKQETNINIKGKV